MHPYTVVWKTFDVKKISYNSLVTKFKHTNIIPLQKFSHEIYLNYSYMLQFYMMRITAHKEHLD